MLIHLFQSAGYKPNPRQAAPDPRLIGIAPETFANLVYFNLNAILARPDRQRSTVTEEDQSGERCWKVEYERRDGIIVSLWFNPARGGGVVRSELRSGARGEIRDSLDSEVVKEPGSGVWFPASCRYQRTVDDKVVQEEELRVQVIQFNQRVDPITFTLAGMNIPPDTPVLRQPKNEPGLTWDGTKVVRRKYSFGDVETPRPWRVSLIAASVAFGVLSAIVLWRISARPGRGDARAA